MLKNMKLGTKIISGFLVLTVIAALVGVIGISNILRISNASEAMYEENVVGLGRFPTFRKCSQYANSRDSGAIRKVPPQQRCDQRLAYVAEVDKKWGRSTRRNTNQK